MIVDSYNDRKSNQNHKDDTHDYDSAFTNKILITQGVATSIDALSVGFDWHSV